MAIEPNGSGFVSLENDDPSADRLYGFVTAAGIDPREVVPWNVYPWAIDSSPSAGNIAEGVGPLREVIELLREIKAVVLMGGEAKQARAAVERIMQEGPAEERFTVFSTYSPARRALQHPDPEVRREREQHIRATFREVAGLLEELTLPEGGPNG